MQELSPRRTPQHGQHVPRFSDRAVARAALLRAFEAAARRDVTVGGVIDIALIDASGVHTERLHLDLATRTRTPE